MVDCCGVPLFFFPNYHTAFQFLILPCCIHSVRRIIDKVVELSMKTYVAHIKQIAKEWHEAFGTNRLKDYYDQYLHEDFTADFFGREVSREQYIQQYGKFAEEFKDNKVVVEYQICQRENVVSVINWTAFHLGNTMGMPVAGTAINIKGVSIDHFRNGKVIRHHPFFDTALLVKRSAVREQVRTRIARDLHDNIGSTLGSVSYYSEMAQQLIREDQPNLATLLKKIEDASHDLVEEMSDIVWAVNPLNDNFAQLSFRMKNYAADLLASRNINFQFETKDVPELLHLSIDQRKNIFLIFKEGIYNAVKYAECPAISTSIYKEDQNLHVELCDNGKGYDVNNKSSYNGNGINNMKRRAEEIGGQLSITSEIGKGTRICLDVPIKPQEYHL